MTDLSAIQNIFVPMETWKRIRVQFTEEEKDALNAAISGQTICPPGVMVEGLKLDADGYFLAYKLFQAVKADVAHKEGAK